MVGFDVAVGGSQDVVNNIVQQLYPVLYKSGLLTQTINVGQVNIASASFDIQQPPTVDFTVSVLPILLEILSLTSF
jgi:hypothetical protein